MILTVDRENFAAIKFSPVTWVAKIKLLSRYIYNANRGQVAKIKRAKIKNAKIKLSENFPIYGTHNFQVHLRVGTSAKV